MLFRYVAFTAAGEEERGTLESDSREQAMAMLARRDLTVSEMAEGAAPRRGASVSAEKLVSFAYELSALLSAGLSLPRALELKLRDKTHLRMHQVNKDLLAQVRNGVPFSVALASHPDVFPSLFPALVRAGESTGSLPDALKQLAAYLEKADTVRNRILSALTYPVTVVALATLILSALLIFMVPRFRDIYAQMGVPIPWFTQIVLRASHGLQFVLLALPVLALLAWSARSRLDRLRLALPGIGPMLQELALANFNKNLALLLKSGVERREAVELAGLACGNEYLKTRFECSRQPLTEGASLHAALEKTGLFSELMLGMVEAGESSGQLPLMLGKAAEVAENRLDQQMVRVLSVLEPVSMTLIGILVGGAILCLGAPLLSLPSLVQQ